MIHYIIHAGILSVFRYDCGLLLPFISTLEKTLERDITEYGVDTVNKNSAACVHIIDVTIKVHLL